VQELVGCGAAAVEGLGVAGVVGEFEEARLGVDELLLDGELLLFRIELARGAVAALEGWIFDGADEHVELRYEVVEGGELDLKVIALEENCMRSERDQLASLEIGRDVETEFASAGLWRPGADRAEMGGQVLGSQALAEEGEKLFALDDDGVALLDAR
jgi:hypothetical protein